MFTAIVLSDASQLRVHAEALRLGIYNGKMELLAHHVTLAMGKIPANSPLLQIGAKRKLTATHYGVTEGRVSAFRVSGADDSRNTVPHVTVGVYAPAKPRESNDIADWIALDETFDVFGTVEICS